MSFVPNFNRNFSPADNNKLATLVKYEPEHDYIRARRNRKSALDPLLPEILKLRDKGWSYLRISNHFKKQYKFVTLNKSTILRRVNLFLGKA